jgi:hypothetical protein
MSFMTIIEEIWDGQVLTGAEYSHTNGNIMDMELATNIPALVDNILGPIWCNILVGVAAAGMASGAHFDILTSDTATFNSSDRIVASIGTDDVPLLTTDLILGAAFSVQVPTRVLHRYVGIGWNVVNESASGGFAVDAWFGTHPIGPIKTQVEPS